MAPSGAEAAEVGSKKLSSSTADLEGHEHGWEDYTCATQWEDFVRSLEDVLRDWNACHTDLVEEHDGSSPCSTPSKCLEHDGQLFSIQLMPAAHIRRTMNLAVARIEQQQHRQSPLHATPATTNTVTRTRAKAGGTDKLATKSTNITKISENNSKSAASNACDLANRSLDFHAIPNISPIQRWFGLKQYILLRALGHESSGAMGIDQILWAITIAAGNCECSIPVLVSCDWDGLDKEEDVCAAGVGVGIGGGASCKGYSAPGSKGVSCSVSFQTARTEKPPPNCLFLDGLSDLFVSKLKDVHSTVQIGALSPSVTASVQHSWVWWTTTELGPEPSLSWRGAACNNERVPAEGDLQAREDIGGRGGGGESDERARVVVIGERKSADGWGHERSKGDRETGQSDDCGGGDVRDGDVSARKKAAILRLIGAIRGEDGDKVLWGPTEDPLVSIAVHVRWTDLPKDLVDESGHYTNLDPMQPTATYSGSGSFGGISGQWFVKARWRGDAQKSLSSSYRPLEDDRLASACFRLLAALVLTTTMHPGTLMADLGAAEGPDGLLAAAEDYAKAAAAELSAETRVSVAKMCSKAKAMHLMDHDRVDGVHDKIDAILRHLLHPEANNTEERVPTVNISTTPLQATATTTTSAGRGDSALEDDTATAAVISGAPGTTPNDTGSHVSSSNKKNAEEAVSSTETGSEVVATTMGGNRRAIVGVDAHDTNDTSITPRNVFESVSRNLPGNVPPKSPAGPGAPEWRQVYSKDTGGRQEVGPHGIEVGGSGNTVRGGFSSSHGWREKSLTGSSEVATRSTEIAPDATGSTGMAAMATDRQAKPTTTSTKMAVGSANVGTAATTEMDGNGALRFRSRGESVDGRGSERSLWAWVDRGGTPVGRLLSLLAMRIADCDDLATMSLLWMSFARDIRLLWEEGATLARMQPIPEVDGDSMFRAGLGGTGQCRGIAAQLRARRATGKEVKNCVMSIDGSPGELSGETFCSGRRAGVGGHPYPDTRMCLIWQKLQMLNCCRAESIASGSEPGISESEADVEATAAELKGRSPEKDVAGELKPGVNGSGVSGDGTAKPGKDGSSRKMERIHGISGSFASGRRGSEPDTEDDDFEDAEFYDTHEYPLQSSEEYHGRELQQQNQQQQQQQRPVDSASVGGDHIDGSGNGDGEGGEGGEGGDCASGIDAEGAAIVCSGWPRTGDSAGTIGDTDALVSGSSSSIVEKRQPERQEGQEQQEQQQQEQEDDGHTCTVPVQSTSAEPTSSLHRPPNQKEDDELRDTVDVDAKISTAYRVGGSKGSSETTTSPVESELLPANRQPDRGDITASEKRRTDDEPVDFPVVSVAGGSCASIVADPAKDKSEKSSFVGNTTTATVISSSPRPQTASAPHISSSEKAGTAAAAATTTTTTISSSSDPPARPVQTVATAIGPADPWSTSSSPGAGTATPEISATRAFVTPLCLRLLRSGAAVRLPSLAVSGPLTEDILEQQKRSNQSAGVATHRIREVLVADMVAFRRANGFAGGDAVFADFVRWYRPEFWQSFTGDDDGWIAASDNRSGGRQADDLRLAWPGQGQVLWGNQQHTEASLTSGTGDTPPSQSPPHVPPAVWLSCWRESACKATEAETYPAGAQLFSGVKEGEKALHYLETISPGPLLAQLLSALLGLSVFVLETGCTATWSSACGLPAVKDVIDSARAKTREAVERLTQATCGEQTSGGDSTGNSSCSSFRAAMVAADKACLEVRRAESVLTKAVSLQRALAGQDELVNMMIASEAEGDQETYIESNAHKAFFRDLLRDQLRTKTPTSVDELLASLEEEQRRGGNNIGAEHGGDSKTPDANIVENTRDEFSSPGDDDVPSMPPPHTKEYVLRCQTSSPFYSRNIGRAQMSAYPTPPSRMYAKTDGKKLRVALSICESEL